MLTAEENERLTQVGPGTPMGKLMRWYWHPIAATIQLKDKPVRQVRILGEDLVLYRDRSGNLGLIGNRCAHRATGLWNGIPDKDGLRCPYHGWKYDATGQCLDQPLEPPGSNFKLTVKIKGYPVAEMGGLIWAYLGEAPVPVLPRWDQFVRPDVFRIGIAATMLPCNWLQCLENGGDPNHGNYLHAHFFRYVLERNRQLGRPVQQEAIDFLKKEWYMTPPGSDWDGTITDEMRHGFREIRTERYVYGQRKWIERLRPVKGGAERTWAENKLIVFPYMRGDQIGVPVDDTHTLHFIYLTHRFDPSVGLPRQDEIPYFEPPWQFEDGEPNFSYITAQDELGWWSQGEITDRTQEHLGYTDRGVISLRELVQEQLEIVEEGGEPMNVFWDPTDVIPMDAGLRQPGGGGEGGGQSRLPIDTAQFTPIWDHFWELYQKDQAIRAARRPNGPQPEIPNRMVQCDCCVPLDEEEAARQAVRG